LSGVRPDLPQLIRDAGMSEFLPPTQLIPQLEAPWQAFYNALDTIFAQVSPEAALSPEWRSFFDELRLKQSVSFWRDSCNDPATLGFVACP
jgi:hypothetical protein